MGALLAAAATVALLVVTRSSIGPILIATSLLVMLDAEGHRSGSVSSRPFYSFVLDIIFMALAFGFLGVSGAAVGMPLAYVTAGAVLFLQPRQATFAISLAALSFGAIPGIRLELGSSFEDPISTWIGFGISILFGVFLVSIVWSVFKGTVHRSAQLQQSLRYQGALARCSQTLLAESDDALAAACEALLSATRSDSVSVGEVFDGGDGRKWIRPLAKASLAADGSPTREATSEASPGVVPSSAAGLATGQTVTRQARDLGSRTPEDSNERRTRTELLSPIMLDGAWIGTLAFVDRQAGREWSDAERDSIQVATGLFSSYFAKQRDHTLLQQTMSARDDFITHASHELQSPLTTVTGLSAELMEHIGEMPKTDLVEIVSVITNQAATVSSIVEDLVANAQADSGKLSIRDEAVALDSLLRDLVAKEQRQAPPRKHLAMRGTAPDVRGDALRIRQIVRNLVSNAIFYGGPHIWVEAEQRGDSVVVKVCDDGPPLLEGERYRMFSPQWVTDPSEHTSNGLRLDAARDLARLMGGDLTIAPVETTTFELTLPVTE